MPGQFRERLLKRHGQQKTGNNLGTCLGHAQLLQDRSQRCETSSRDAREDARPVTPRDREYSHVRGLLIDIDGVLVTSWKALPGAVDALTRIRDAGVPVRLLTNTTSRTKAHVTTTLRELGFPVNQEDIVTVASTMAAHVEHLYPGARCLVINSGDVSPDLRGIRIAAPDAPADDVDVVILGGAGPEYDWPTLNRVLECLLRGAPLLAMHRNVVWRTDAGLRLDTGAFLDGLERAANITATVIGQPSAAMFDEGLLQLGLDRGDVAMIGDDLDTDVRGAQAAGLIGIEAPLRVAVPDDRLAEHLTAAAEQSLAPWEDALDLNLDRHRQDRADQDDQAQDHGILDRGLGGDRADEVGRDEDLQAQQDRRTEGVAQDEIGGTAALPAP